MNTLQDTAIGSRTFKIGLFDLNTRGKATILHIAHFLQETGLSHGLKLMEERGTDIQSNLAFVLTRLQIKMERYPQLNEDITINTWLSPVKGNYIIRNFEIFDEEDKYIGGSINSAVPFDLVERKLVPVPNGGADIIVSKKEPPFFHLFEKLKRPEETEYSKNFDAGYFDCDLYGHINNVKYIQWALDTLPAEFVSETFLREVDVNFRSESDFRHGIIGRVESESEKDNEYNHQLTRVDNGKELIIMKSIWESGIN